MPAKRLFLLGLFLSIFAAACGGHSEEHEGCHDDTECAEGLHCHIEDGEDEGECEAEDE